MNTGAHQVSALAVGLALAALATSSCIAPAATKIEGSSSSGAGGSPSSSSSGSVTMASSSAGAGGSWMFVASGLERANGVSSISVALDGFPMDPKDGDLVVALCTFDIAATLSTPAMMKQAATMFDTATYRVASFWGSYSSSTPKVDFVFSSSVTGHCVMHAYRGGTVAGPQHPKATIGTLDSIECGPTASFNGLAFFVLTSDGDIVEDPAPPFVIRRSAMGYGFKSGDSLDVMGAASFSLNSMANNKACLMLGFDL